MVEFSCEAVWTWAFVCWKISDYSFNFCACDEPVNIFYFFLVQLESCTFLRICPFLPHCPFYWHITADSSLLWSFVFLCCLLWSLRFSNLLIWFLSLCFLMSLANGLSSLFILSKNQLLALLIFAMVPFVSLAFISSLIFKISFPLLALGFSISSFSSCFRCRVKLFIWLFFLFFEVCLYC